MKLATMTQVSVGGVIQGNGGASDEDRGDGFERGGNPDRLTGARDVARVRKRQRAADVVVGADG